MILRPCASCRRHIAADETVCPFCASTTVSVTFRIARHASKLSRAAIFAGAAACYTSTPDPQPPPPPPPQEQLPAETPPDDTTTQSEQTFAKPPAGRSSLRGVVRQGGRPLAGALVRAYRITPMATATATTDAKGQFVFPDLEPGNWEITPDVPTGQRFGPQPNRVTLVDGAEERLVLDVPLPPPPDRGPCCKPYGAPPARRRVV